MQSPDKRSTGNPAAQTPPRQGTVMQLLRTADDLRRYFADLYEPYEITSQQYNVLRILRGAHPEALPTMEIAERMVEKTPGITRLLDRLEEKELIVRDRPPHDRRRVLIAISAAGLELLEALEEPVRSATTGVLEGVSSEEVEQLNGILTKVRHGLEG